MTSRVARALIYGLGRSGRAAAMLLARQGAEIVFYDDRVTELPEGASWASGASLYTGTLAAEALDGVELAVVSPGVPPHAPAMRRLSDSGIPCISEIELASRATSRPFVAVTGTNGKSTTVSLIAELMRAGGTSCLAVGNIGYPFSQAVVEHPEVQCFAVEVSSYQLATIHGFAPRVGVVTNLAGNHHQWHGSVEAYFAAKLRVFENLGPGGAAVYPAGSEYLREALSSSTARKVSFTWGGRAGDVDFDAEGQRIVWRESGECLLDVAAAAGRPGFDYRAVLWNLLAAVAVGRAWGLSNEAFDAGLRSFSPLEHRMEPVRELYGVRWVNDSKSTNVESTRYAIENSPAPIVLMLGGRDKGLDFGPLADGQEGHIKAVVALGECRSKIREQLAGRLAVHLAEDLAAAVGSARRLACEGDIVLFSPACASFDMFENFEQRGRAFKQLVLDLSSESAVGSRQSTADSR